jgi:hypothetical protein
MRKKPSTPAIPAASPEALQATIINHNPSRKGHRPPPKEWSCKTHGSVGCMACWWVLEATRLHNEKTMPSALQTELPPEPAVQSSLATDPGVSSSLPTQVAQIFSVPLPERKADGTKIEEQYRPPEPQRQFYRRKSPPDYSCKEFMEWFNRNSATLGDRMLPEDVAFLLTQGAFHYEDYENLKHKGPRQVFQAAGISFDNPSYKRSWTGQHERNPLDTQMPTLLRAQEGGTSAVGTGDEGILTLEKPDPILVEALPELIRGRDFKRGKRVELTAEREKVKTELWELSPKNKESACVLTGVARASAQRKCKRRIADIDEEIRAMERDWRQVRMTGTGRPSFILEIPPCPQGSKVLNYLSEADRGYRLLTRKKMRAYMAQAFGTEAKDYPDRWARCTAALENAILRHAETRGLLGDWIKDPTAPVENTRWLDEDFEVLFEELQEPTALENSQTGYKRDERGELPDATIQRGATKNHGDWRWSQGRPPDEEGTSGREKK